jgi:hypothetical protein
MFTPVWKAVFAESELAFSTCFQVFFVFSQKLHHKTPYYKILANLHTVFIKEIKSKVTNV